MKLLVYCSGLPNLQLNVTRSTTIADAKNMLSVEHGLKLEDFQLSFMNDELKDSITIGDIILGESDETAVDLVMAKRAGVFMRNLGESKWLIYGTTTSFQVIPMDQDEGTAIKTNIFGIATQLEEIEGKKTYMAKIYKANANHMTREYRQVKIEGSGRQSKVIKVKTDGTEKELIPIDTLMFDEGHNNPNSGPDTKDFVLPVMKFLTMVGLLIKTGLELAN